MNNLWPYRVGLFCACVHIPFFLWVIKMEFLSILFLGIVCIELYYKKIFYNIYSGIFLYFWLIFQFSILFVFLLLLSDGGCYPGTRIVNCIQLVKYIAFEICIASGILIFISPFKSPPDNNSADD